MFPIPLTKEQLKTTSLKFGLSPLINLICNFFRYFLRNLQYIQGPPRGNRMVEL